MTESNQNRVNSSSLDITTENIEKLKELFPEILTENKIDFDKLRIVLGDEVDDSPEKYSFNWNGKKQAIKMAQQSTIATLKPKKEDSKDWDTTENLYIEGDNLEVLKLLQKTYHSKVKMIYIDPPYNTGKDFVYKDNFKDNLKNYLEVTGQVDEEGNKLSSNSDTSGRYHTDWLNMMYPRLKLARNLLNEEGLIFISINDIEVNNLIKISDEIFGENNRVADLIWSNKEGGGSSDSLTFRIKHEHIIVYSKNINKIEINGVDISNEDRYKNSDDYENIRGKYYLQKLGMGSIQYSSSLDYPIIAPDDSEIYPSHNNGGNRAAWRWSKQKLDWGIKNGYVVIQKDSKGIWTVYTKQYLKADNDGNIIRRTQRPMGIIDEFSSTQASKELVKIGMGTYFSYSKPTKLIEWLIKRVVTSKEDIILDFFSGSSTTAESVIKVNAEDGVVRKFIMVQLPEQLSEKDEAYKDGYRTIPEIAKERIRRAGDKILEENPSQVDKLDIGFKVFELGKSNMKKWNVDSTKLEEQISFMEGNFEDGSKSLDIVYEIMLKQGLDLTFPISEHIIGDAVVYEIAFGAMFVVLGDKITSKIADFIIKQIKEQEIENPVVVFQDEKFVDDSEKLNTIEQLNAGGVQYADILSI